MQFRHSDKASKALAAAGGDPEKEAKIKAALEKAAKLKAERAAAQGGAAPKAPGNEETKKS